MSPRAEAPACRDDEEAPRRVLRRFRLVFNAVKAHFREVERKAGLAGAQVWALSVVNERPGVGVGELARAMDVHQSTASNLLRALIEKRLVVAARAEHDRRATALWISQEGLRALERAPGPFEGVLPDALSRLDPAVLQRLDADLAILIDLLDADERAAGIPLGQPDS